MPCLNEAETVGICVTKALNFLKNNGVAGEALIADNGSTDGSQDIARSVGARVIDIPERGYGAALNGGCAAALGKYVIMGDADDSYDFSSLAPFLERLRAGDDLVMGNRFTGGIEENAMPPLHRYLGNPVLSFVGRLFFKSSIGDFHCGLRGYNVKRIRELDLRTTGMEYASEMVVQATLHGYKISEVPTTLSVDGRSRPPHLRSWRDGWRHLKFLLMHSPNWLFFYPGIFLIVLGVLFTLLLEFQTIVISGVAFSINTLLYSVAMIIIGVNLALFSIYTKIYALQSHFIPPSPTSSPNTKKNALSFIYRLNTEKCILSGLAFATVGLALAVLSVALWGGESFGALNPERFMRITIPAAGAMVIGVQLMFAGFFIDILRIKTK